MAGKGRLICGQTCKICGNYAKIKAGLVITQDIREKYVSCTNPECGARWVMITHNQFKKFLPKLNGQAYPEDIANPATKLG